MISPNNYKWECTDKKCGGKLYGYVDSKSLRTLIPPDCPICGKPMRGDFIKKGGPDTGGIEKKY